MRKSMNRSLIGAVVMVSSTNSNTRKEGDGMGKKIGILGSGAVGTALAKGFAKHGFDVVIGTNSLTKVNQLAQSTGTRADSFAAAVRHGEIIVLAVKGNAAETVIASIGNASLKGKTIIDATNPIAELPPVNGVIQYFTGPNESLMERLQRSAPDANFVKAFSCIGSALMVNPDLGGQKPAMFYCGNSDSAKAEVRDILVKFGFSPEDMGKAEGARAIEPLAMLWCIPGMRENHWQHAFALLK
jgi:8-hydroxy-5-deazaflavin:NADPH oxidoreductase